MTDASTWSLSSETIAETMSGFLWSADAEGRLTSATSGFGRTAGLPVTEALGRPLIDLIEGPSDRKRFAEALAAGAPFRDLTLRFWPARRWTRLGGLMRDGGHVGVAVDIDEERARMGLIEAALDRLPDGAAVFDRDHRLVAFNEAYRRHNAPIDDMLSPGRSFEELFRISIARGQYPEQPGDVEALIAERVAQHKRGQGTFKRLRPGGDWALYRYFPLPDGGSATLITDITESERQQAELTRLATTDPLTGIANRRSFFAHAQREVERAKRYGPPLGVFVLDLDHFKRVNDTHGHAVGDVVLQSIARHSASQLRVTDIIARTGGEEFGALMPETPPEEIGQVVDRIRRSIADLEIDTSAGKLGVTASIGFSSLLDGEDRIDPALARADAALYRAKLGGRNRVEGG
ncbi:MAG: diguanylate cyclase [Alphaproteobacteria bacterium]|nr:diguanylate cyclase [Alphaproteobacteria bacterium]